MKARQLFSLFASLILLFLFGPVALAQTPTPTPEPPVPHVQMSEDGVVDGTVHIIRAYTEGPAWAVIHADADGKPGPVIGHEELEVGDNLDVIVEIDEEAVTPLLHVMLHVDEGVVGTFEFPGPDVPMTLEDNIVMAIFSAAPPLPEAEAETTADATPTAAAEEESEAEAAAGAEATPTAAAEEESEAESAVGAEATPTAAAEEETEVEAAVTAAVEEEADFAPTAAAPEEAEVETAAPAAAADASAKGAAPTSMPATGAGPALSLILGVIGVIVSALGGSVLFLRRRG